MSRYLKAQSDQLTVQETRRAASDLLKETFSVIDTSNVPRYYKKQIINQARKHIGAEIQAGDPYENAIAIVESTIQTVRPTVERHGGVIRSPEIRPQPVKRPTIEAPARPVISPKQLFRGKAR